MDKIAIFGGTFDPIHMGHISLADSAIAECSLDKLIFMPNFISPFKTEQYVTPGEIRYEMIESILSLNPAYDVTDYELNNTEPSYTYDTLTYFREELSADIYFVLGYDSIYALDTWYRGDELLREFSFITARRPGTDYDSTLAKIREYESKYDADIKVLLMEPFDASSSDIRNRIRVGLPIVGLLPPTVERYIYENGLYR